MVRYLRARYGSSLAPPTFGLGSYEAAEESALAIKKAHPMLHVAVYDAVERVNKLIELPK